MIFSRKNALRRIVPGISLFFLMVLLTACGGLGSSGGSTPTAVPATPTPTATATPSVALQTYTGNGFTIGYPTDWKVQTISGQIAFEDALGVNALTIAMAPNPGGAASASSLADTTLPVIEQEASVKNPQPVAGLAPTVTYGGESWVQRGITGSVSSGGQTIPGELILLVDNHPAASPTTKAFELYYAGPTITFSTMNTTIFPAMLQSFKFTA